MNIHGPLALPLFAASLALLVPGCGPTVADYGTDESLVSGALEVCVIVGDYPPPVDVSDVDVWHPAAPWVDAFLGDPDSANLSASQGVFCTLVFRDSDMDVVAVRPALIDPSIQTVSFLPYFVFGVGEQGDRGTYHFTGEAVQHVAKIMDGLNSL